MTERALRAKKAITTLPSGGTAMSSGRDREPVANEGAEGSLTAFGLGHARSSQETSPSSASPSPSSGSA
ncbi:hypothetical protein [Streptosporangium carneum]|uniref:hypothetical protein n=1 Tax=Streptosporangium carneum TaxID=47481 RepID=UPI0022F2CFD7|nr:hypothetical protein [Streptosporangium carneum]